MRVRFEFVLRHRSGVRSRHRVRGEVMKRRRDESFVRRGHHHLGMMGGNWRRDVVVSSGRSGRSETV